MKKQAIIMYGPSGAGKTTIISKILKAYHYKHCNTDAFRFALSDKRSHERSEIAALLSFTYAKELIKRKHDIIIESLHEKELQALKKILQKENYEIHEVSLVASLAHCLHNNAKREKPFSKIAVKEAHKHYSFKRGIIINIEEIGLTKTYEEIKKKVIKKRRKKLT